MSRASRYIITTYSQKSYIGGVLYLSKPNVEGVNLKRVGTDDFAKISGGRVTVKEPRLQKGPALICLNGIYPAVGFNALEMLLEVCENFSKRGVEVVQYEPQTGTLILVAPHFCTYDVVANGSGKAIYSPPSNTARRRQLAADAAIRRRTSGLGASALSSAAAAASSIAAAASSAATGAIDLISPTLIDLANLPESAYKGSDDASESPMDLTESPPRAYKGSENTLSTPTRTGGRKRDHEEVEPLLDSANANRTYGARKMPAATSPGRKRPAVRSQDESGSYDSEDYSGQRRRDDELASIIRAKLSDPSLDEELKKKVVEVKRITFRPMNAEAFTHPKGRNNDLAETVNEGTVVARSNLSKAMTREQLREEINGLRNGQQGVSYSSYKDGVPNRKGKKKPKISACWPPHPNPDSKAADVFEFCLICAGLI